VSKLDEAFLDIASAISQSASDTRELSGATDDMARRTEQQAAALEQTAAAIEEISTISKQSSERTKEAREVVSQTSDQAARSGQTVTEAIAAMGKIEESSKKITQIITVIDEISFQTNLLALNAGVEAARAGEAGRGFAVVAQEVRELAQRSASAAKEIKELIEASFSDVLTGVELVNKTGEALGSIGSQVQVISDHFATISQAAQEQSTGISEINSSLVPWTRSPSRTRPWSKRPTPPRRTCSGSTRRLPNWPRVSPSPARAPRCSNNPATPRLPETC
jgi:methyl-accepting chemotaxis protein